MDHVRHFLKYDDVQILAVCDVDAHHFRDRTKGPAYGREVAQQTVVKSSAQRAPSGRGECAAYRDYRELCGRDDIDAVVVSTPDHWHALCDLEAIRQGKDVYGEKPITHFFREGQALVRAVKKSGAVFQTGSQQRSSGNFRRAAELIRNGLIGRVTHVEVGLPAGYLDPQGETTITAPPRSVDYEMWCGPAPKLPFMRARYHRWWRGHRAFGGGTLMDWIGHHNDIAHWGMNFDRGGPSVVEAVGWTWPKTDIYNTPVNFEIRSTYDHGTQITISTKFRSGVKWIGNDGWVYVDRGKLEASQPEWLTPEFQPGPEKVIRSNDHRRNFLDCVKSRASCIAPAETAHRSITPGHLAYISQALSRPVRWNPRTESFLDDPEAEKLLAFDYRAPWAL